jgi:hypothetical protein
MEIPPSLRQSLVRGPGATLWGANTVNGVSKHARDAQGALISAGGGFPLPIQNKRNGETYSVAAGRELQLSPKGISFFTAEPRSDRGLAGSQRSATSGVVPLRDHVASGG